MLTDTRPGRAPEPLSEVPELRRRELEGAGPALRGALRCATAVEPEQQGRSPDQWGVLLGALALPAALFVLGRMLEPDPRGWGTHEQLGFRPCFPMRVWNFPCPGCGVTTSIALAAHGQPLAALRTQPFGLVVLATALVIAVRALAGHVRGQDLWAELARIEWKRSGKILATLGLLAWCYKIALVRGWLG